MAASPGRLVATAVGGSLLVAAALTRGAAQDVVLTVAGALVLGLALAGYRACPRTCRGSLTLLVAGLAGTWLNGAVRLVGVLADLDLGPAQAVLTVLGYTALLGAALSLLLAPRPRPSGALLDSAVIAVSTALVVWQLVLGPFTRDAGMSEVTRVVASLVLLLQVATIGATVTMHHTSAERPLPLTLFSLASVALLGSGVGRGVTTSGPDATAAWWPGTLLVLAFGLIALALAHPASRGLADRELRRSGHITPATVIATGAGLSAGPIVGIVHEIADGHLDSGLANVSMALLVPVVLTRIWLLSRSRDEAEARLAWMARFDELTGLANRRELTDRLAQAVARVQAGETPAVVVTFGDLNGFKEINDVHGHHVGDQVLAVIARRLRAAVRESDLVARFGGDEFVVVAEGDAEVLAHETVQRIASVANEPVQIGAVTARVGMSTGTAVGTRGPGLDASRLLSAADASMYHQKRARRGVLRTTAVPRRETTARTETTDLPDAHPDAHPGARRDHGDPNG